ncbi:MAG: D-alanine aminotransferase Dat [candidate division Zixibacteria bacterium]|nr:D-alanine aminotransferase Dat [candidate division Zixibacteria bacterium]
MQIYLNGSFVEKDRAGLSVDERGFLLADGLYEVVRVYGGNMLRLEDHLERLRHGCRELSIEYDDFSQIEEIAYKLLGRNSHKSGQATVYIQITRGVAPRKHRFPSKGTRPTVYIATSPISPNLDQIKAGIAAITVDDIRWKRCDLKTIALLPNVLAQEGASRSGAQEALFVDAGNIMEGTHSNCFAIKAGRLFTPPLSNKILAGITRKIVFEICAQTGLDVYMEPIPRASISGLDELFITSTTLEITPVIRLDDNIINESIPGQLTMQVQKMFYEYIARECDYPALLDIL